MSNDPKTNEFVRHCVLLAARCNNMDPTKWAASAAFMNVARMAIESPQETAPIHHYVGILQQALTDAFGFTWELADLSNAKQEEAIAAWRWLSDVAGIDDIDANHFGRTLTHAVAEMRKGGNGWRTRMRAILARDVVRTGWIPTHS